MEHSYKHEAEYIFQYSNKGNYWGFNLDDDNHNNDDDDFFFVFCPMERKCSSSNLAFFTLRHFSMKGDQNLSL